MLLINCPMLYWTYENKDNRKSTNARDKSRT